MLLERAVNSHKPLLAGILESYGQSIQSVKMLRNVTVVVSNKHMFKRALYMWSGLVVASLPDQAGLCELEVADNER